MTTIRLALLMMVLDEARLITSAVIAAVHVRRFLVVVGAMRSASGILPLIKTATLLQVAVIMMVTSVIITVIVTVLVLIVVIWSVELPLLSVSIMIAATSCIFVVSRSEVAVVVIRLPGPLTLRLVQRGSHHTLGLT